MNSGTAIRMKGSTPAMKLRKIDSRGWDKPVTQIIPTVVAMSAYMSGTPATAMMQNTRNMMRANMTQAP